jgi:hypothetical protein
VTVKKRPSSRQKKRKSKGTASAYKLIPVSDDLEELLEGGKRIIAVPTAEPGPTAGEINEEEILGISDLVFVCPIGTVCDLSSFDFSGAKSHVIDFYVQRLIKGRSTDAFAAVLVVHQLCDKPGLVAPTMRRLQASHEPTFATVTGYIFNPEDDKIIVALSFTLDESANKRLSDITRELEAQEDSSGKVGMEADALDQLQDIEQAMQRVQAPVVRRFQHVLDGLAGRNFGTNEANAAVAARIQSIANGLKKRIAAPDGKPTVLRWRQSGKYGSFELRAQHGGVTKTVLSSVNLPDQMTLTDQPLGLRRQRRRES